MNQEKELAIRDSLRVEIEKLEKHKERVMDWMHEREEEWNALSKKIDHLTNQNIEEVKRIDERRKEAEIKVNQAAQEFAKIEQKKQEVLAEEARLQGLMKNFEIQEKALNRREEDLNIEAKRLTDDVEWLRATIEKIKSMSI